MTQDEKTAQEWRDVADNDVRHVWYSCQDNDEQVCISPDFYECNGTPVDTEGDDMVYSHTEVRVKELRSIEILRNSLKTVDAFHTPESRQDANVWCEIQGPDMSVGFMVGYNYAVSQALKILNGTHPGLTEKEDSDG